MQYSKPEHKLLAKPTPLMEKMSNDSGFSFISTANFQDILQKNLLRTWHTNGENPEVDSLVEKAWRNIYQYKFSNATPEQNPLGPAVLGPPGQGKTSVFVSAMANIAKAMGRQFHYNPPMGKKVDPNDLIFRTLIMSGEVTNTSVSGIPYIEELDEENGTKVTRYAPPEYLATLQYNNFTCLIEDDLLNAHHPVQNNQMDFIHTKEHKATYIGENTLTGMTGNLGALDGTNVNKQSSALTSRLQSFVCGDTPGDFCERAYRKYIDGKTDNAGTAFVTDFIIDTVDEEPLVFFDIGDKKLKSTFTNSRTLEALIVALRNEIHDYDCAVEENAPTMPLFERFELTVGSYVRPSFAEKFLPYVQDMLTLARPVANELLEFGSLSDITRERFKSQVSKNDDASSERLTNALLRQVQTRCANDIFFGFQKIIPPGIVALHPEMNAEIEKSLLKEGERKAQKAVHAFCEACFGTGMIKNGRQNAVMNAVQKLVIDLIQKSNNTPGARKGLFGKLDTNNQPIVKDAFFKGLVEVAGKFNTDYKDGEALTVVNKRQGKDITALETCFVEPLSAISEIDKELERAQQAGMSM